MTNQESLRGKTWQGKTWQGKTWQGKTWQGKRWRGKRGEAIRFLDCFVAALGIGPAASGRTVSPWPITPRKTAPQLSHGAEEKSLGGYFKYTKGVGESGRPQSAG